MRLINTVENSLFDLEKKGSLDIAFEVYNPNDYFDKVYHVSYFYEDKNIKTPSKIKIISPWYFKFLNDLKKYRLIRLAFYPIVYIFHIFFLTAFIYFNKIDIARGRMPYLMSFSLGIAARLNRIPFIISFGGDNRLAQDKIGKYHLFNIRWLSYWIEEQVINFSDVVFVPNEYTKKYIHAIFKGKKSIEVVPLPLRKSFFQSTSSIENVTRADYFLFVGRLVGDKHPDFLISVYKKYLDKSQDQQTKFKIIGNGSMLKELKQQVKKLNIQDKVEFLGFKKADEIKKYTQEAKVSLIPVSGFVVYEAAVFGNPIITSDIEWHSEFIEDYKNGWVCKYLDEDEWSDRLVEIMENYDQTLLVASNLKEKMQAMNPDNIFTKEIEIYKRLINR